MKPPVEGGVIKTKQFVTVCVLLVAAGLYINLHADIMVPMNKPFAEFPSTVGGWRMLSQTQFDADTLSVLRPTDYLSRTYTGPDGRIVQLYVGYHGGGKGGGEIHSPKNCLPGSGWHEASSKKARLMFVDGKVLDLVEAVYQKGEEREIFLYWYQVKGRSIINEYELKLSEILNSMLHRRRDASFIRISVPVQGNTERALAAGEQFVKDVYPAIIGYLPS